MGRRELYRAGDPDRPGPHRVRRQHAGAGLRGRRAAAAAALLDRAEQRGDGGQQRAGRGGDRPDAGRVDRPGRLGAGDHRARGAGGLRRPAGPGGRRTAAAERAVRGGSGRRRRSVAPPGTRALTRRVRRARARAGSAGVLLGEDAARAPRRDCRSKSPSVRSCPSGTSRPCGRGRPPAAPRPTRNSARSAPTWSRMATSDSPSGAVGAMRTSPSPLGPLMPSSSSSRPKAQVTGRVAGQMEGHPHRVRIPALVPELHRDPEGELLGDEEAHHDLGLDRLAHLSPRMVQALNATRLKRPGMIPHGPLDAIVL